jgi:hypothetical protein
MAGASPIAMEIIDIIYFLSCLKRMLEERWSGYLRTERKIPLIFLSIHGLIRS